MFAPAANMLGYYEACYFGCGPCGTSCKTLDVSHDTWMHRQYSYDRVLPTGHGALATGGTCATVTASGSCRIRSIARSSSACTVRRPGCRAQPANSVPS